MKSMKYTKEEARRVVLNCAKLYQQKLLNKRFMIIYRERLDNRIRYIEVVFLERNYQHLTGLELVDKVIGGINFCLGLSKEMDYFVPSSALLENIKNLTDSPSQVLAILEKSDKSKKYSIVKHVAKGLNLKKILLPAEIKEMINLDDYIYKKNK